MHSAIRCSVVLVHAGPDDVYVYRCIGLCRLQQKKLVAAVRKAWDHGTLLKYYHAVIPQHTCGVGGTSAIVLVI